MVGLIIAHNIYYMGTFIFKWRDMRRLPILSKKHNQMRYALVDDATFSWANSYKWYLNGGYPTAFIQREAIKLHQCVLGVSLIKGYVTDHLNNDPLDNRRNNLEIVSHAENVKRGKKYLRRFHGSLDYA